MSDYTLYAHLVKRVTDQTPITGYLPVIRLSISKLFYTRGPAAGLAFLPLRTLVVQSLQIRAPVGDFSSFSG